MKFIVTRSRVVNEAIHVDAASAEEAVETSRQTKRKNWAHVESKKRSNYEARKVN